MIKKILKRLRGKVFSSKMNQVNYSLVKKINKANSSMSEFTPKYEINLIGYFSSILGVAEVGRNFAQTLLKQKEVTARVIPICLPGAASLPLSDILALQTRASKHSNLASENIFFIGADQIKEVYLKNTALFKNHWNYVVFWWEFESGFPFLEAFDYADEIIVFTSFIYSALAPVVPFGKRIRKLTYPLVIEEDLLLEKHAARELFGLSSDSFIVLFSFDLNSSIIRKNPYAVITAFKDAISRYPDCYLVLKISGGNNFPHEYEKLQQFLIEENLLQRVLLNESNLSRINMLNLINTCDVYMSLHRAEGLGLGMLEAMWLGKVVIATNYGGNTDFMTATNSVCIDYKFSSLEQGFGPYRQGLRCAEPDIDQATKALFQLYNDSKLISIIGQEAKKSVRTQYSLNKFKQDFYSLFKYNK